jgi:YggT family protein
VAASRIGAPKSSTGGVFAFRLPAGYSCRNIWGLTYMLFAIFWLLGQLIHLYILAIIAAVVISLLINFGVINGRSRFVYTIADFLTRLTEPLLGRIRSFLPDLGGIDISPVIAILVLEALQYVLADIYGRLVMAGMGF